MKRLTVLLALLCLYAIDNLSAQTSQTSGSTEPLRTTFIDSVKEVAATTPPNGKIAGSADFLGNGQAGIALQDIANGQRDVWILDNGAYAYTTALPSAPIQWQIEDH
jgi:hypothetical protein